MLTRNDQLKVAIGVAVLLVTMIVLYALGILEERPVDGAEALPAVPSPLVPRPSASDLAKAEAEVRDVFGKELAGVRGQLLDSRRRESAVALAAKMIETAAGSRPAAKYALLVQARELAIAAGDSGVGIQAVEQLAGFRVQGSGKPRDAASWASEGHRLWSLVSSRKPSERLRTRLEAAECYLRAVEGLEGFQRRVVKKRLAELGREDSSLSLADAVQFFGLDRTAWKVDGDCLRGTLGDLNTADGWAMGTVAKPTSAMDFSFSMKAPTAQCIRIEIDGASWVYIRGSHANNHSSFWRGREGHWSMADTRGPHIDPPDAWHRLSVRLAKGKVTFFFDGQPVQETQVAPAGAKPKTVRVGFGRQRAEVRVKEFRLTVDRR